MSTPTTASACSTFTDERLLDLLVTEEDRLTREAAEEIVARGPRMIDPLTAIIRTESAWMEEGPAPPWRVIHATQLLGAIGGERAVPGLIDALKFSTRPDIDLDWIYGTLPWIFGTLGAAAVQPLIDHARVAERDSFAKTLAYGALGEIGERHVECRSIVRDVLLAVAADSAEPANTRSLAAYSLLPLAQPEDRDLLRTVAGLAGQTDWIPLFVEEDIDECMARGPRPRQFDPLSFYQPDAIADRQERWRKLDAPEPVDSSEPAFHAVVQPAPKPEEPAPIPFVSTEPRTGRNDPCPCGSGKKYKKCCG